MERRIGPTTFTGLSSVQTPISVSEKARAISFTLGNTLTIIRIGGLEAVLSFACVDDKLSKVCSLSFSDGIVRRGWMVSTNHGGKQKVVKIWYAAVPTHKWWSIAKKSSGLTSADSIPTLCRKWQVYLTATKNAGFLNSAFA